MIRARALAENLARSERAVRRQASRDAAETEAQRLENEPLRMAMLRADQDTARREEALAINRSRQLQQDRLRVQAAAEAAANAEADLAWDRMRATRAAERLAARDERDRVAILEQGARWDTAQALRADEERARIQVLDDEQERAAAARPARPARLRPPTQYVTPNIRQNQDRDRRALLRDARREPDLPVPPQVVQVAVQSRLADAVAVASQLSVAAWDWMRRRAQVAREDQLLRDGDDVIDDRDDESQTCTTCTVNKRAVICLPCGHCTQCNGCWRRWKAAPDIEGNFHGPTCPTCREMAVHTLPITQQQRDALSAETDQHHAGSRFHRLPAGRIYMNAQIPDTPLASMHTLLDGLGE